MFNTNCVPEGLGAGGDGVGVCSWMLSIKSLYSLTVRALRAAMLFSWEGLPSGLAEALVLVGDGADNSLEVDIFDEGGLKIIFDKGVWATIRPIFFLGHWRSLSKESSGCCVQVLKRIAELQESPLQ
jgi:hypothetical protein